MSTTNTAPATGEVIGQTPEHTPDDVAAGIRRAREAQRGWQQRSFRERARHVKAVRAHLTDHAEEIARVIALDNGKTVIDAISTEVLPCAMAASYYARNAARVLRTRRVRGGNPLLLNKRARLEHVPFGVIGIISPWNYPFSIPFHEIIMGLMAGNAVVLKAATQTQEVARVLEETIRAGGFPDGLFSSYNLPGAQAAEAFLHGGVDKLFFTGSVRVGKELMAKASERLIPVSLELGGNDAMIVCADANLSRAAAGAAWAGFSNCGQSCGGVERIYVEAPAYEAFMGELRAITRQLRQGDSLTAPVDVGAVTTPQQLATITAHVQDALAKGATIGAVSRHPASNPRGQFYPPTVLEDVTEEMITMREETFGPVVAVAPVSTVDEAIRRANDSSLGLTASVWTRNHGKGRAIAARLEVGVVTINDHLMSHGMAETPWGGCKESGIGRTHGTPGLQEMTQPRCVVDDFLPGVQRNMWWYPHDDVVQRGLLGALRMLYGRTGWIRWKGAMAVTRLFPRTFLRTPLQVIAPPAPSPEPEEPPQQTS